jgi:hypothetical protein
MCAAIDLFIQVCHPSIRLDFIHPWCMPATAPQRETTGRTDAIRQGLPCGLHPSSVVPVFEINTLTLKSLMSRVRQLQLGQG